MRRIEDRTCLRVCALSDGGTAKPHRDGGQGATRQDAEESRDEPASIEASRAPTLLTHVTTVASSKARFARRHTTGTDL